MRKVDPTLLVVRPFELLDLEWALLVAGKDRPSPMTVSWGGFGTLWQRPVVTVFVRPTRHTFSLLDRHPEFTLNFLPESQRDALDLCGTRSGRDLDKWAAAGLEKLPGERVAVPRVGGAELSLECRVLSTADVEPSRFLDPEIAELYPLHDYHRIFFGEVLAAWASERFVASRVDG